VAVYPVRHQFAPGLIYIVAMQEFASETASKWSALLLIVAMYPLGSRTGL
jgi:hypothetical protein